MKRRTKVDLLALITVLSISAMLVPSMKAIESPGAPSCRKEIGDPKATPHTSGLAPLVLLDIYDPAPYGGDEVSPMLRWNDTAAGLHVDAAGHVRVTIRDVTYRHPVGSEQFGLAAVQRYRATGQQVWLDRATTALRDVIATASPGGQVPQEYPWIGHDGKTLAKPAYSSLAQGQAISLAVRLHEITGDQDWRTAADRFFAAVATPGTVSPSISFIDTDGYLWFEEFPLQCPARVWNGHVFATFAMADYARMTGDPAALKLFDAGATTALHYMEQIRVPGERARYDVSHQATRVNDHYHRMMTEQLRDLAIVTGDQQFSIWADWMHADLQASSPGATRSP